MIDETILFYPAQCCVNQATPDFVITWLHK